MVINCRFLHLFTSGEFIYKLVRVLISDFANDNGINMNKKPVYSKQYHYTTIQISYDVICSLFKACYSSLDYNALYTNCKGDNFKLIEGIIIIMLHGNPLHETSFQKTILNISRHLQYLTLVYLFSICFASFSTFYLWCKSIRIKIKISDGCVKLNIILLYFSLFPLLLSLSS